jgi:hypothetical protein
MRDKAVFLFSFLMDALDIDLLYLIKLIVEWNHGYHVDGTSLCHPHGLCC